MEQIVNRLDRMEKRSNDRHEDRRHKSYRGFKRGGRVERHPLEMEVR